MIKVAGNSRTPTTSGTSVDERATRQHSAALLVTADCRCASIRHVDESQHTRGRVWRRLLTTARRVRDVAWHWCRTRGWHHRRWLRVVVGRTATFTRRSSGCRRFRLPPIGRCFDRWCCERLLLWRPLMVISGVCSTRIHAKRFCSFRQYWISELLVTSHVMLVSARFDRQRSSEIRQKFNDETDVGCVKLFLGIRQLFVRMKNKIYQGQNAVLMSAVCVQNRISNFVRFVFWYCNCSVN